MQSLEYLDCTYDHHQATHDHHNSTYGAMERDFHWGSNNNNVVKLQSCVKAPEWK